MISHLVVAMTVLGSLIQDTVFVSANSPPVWGEEIRLVHEWQIGDQGSSLGSWFARISSVTVAIDGSVWVVDGQGPRIARYGPDGRFLGFVGRVGSGPGEFRGILALARYPGGRVAVRDGGNGRVSIFGRDGILDRTVTAVGSGYYSRGQTFQTDTAGRIHLQAAVGSRGGWTDTVPQAWVVYDSVGRVIRQRPAPRASILPTFLALLTGDGTRESFTDKAVEYVGSNGSVVSGRTTRYRLQLRTMRGDLRVIDRPWEPVEISRSERSMWRSKLKEARERAGGRSRIAQLPSTKPAFRSLRIDLSGRIVVGRYVAAQYVEPTPEDLDRWQGRTPYTYRERSTYDFFSDEGVFLGTLTLPKNTDLAEAEGDRIWVVGRGQHDVPFIAQYRISRGR